MCNACGFQCCGSDQLDGCGCDSCRDDACWERCQWCGDHIQFDGCHCDDDEEEHP